MLQRLFNLLGWDRADLRIINSIQCRPPNDWFDPRAPYYHGALQHCRVHRDPVLAEGHAVVIPMGNVATRTILGLEGHKKVKIGDFHGTMSRDPQDRFWVVPTFHPSFLQRGAHNLIGTVLWDLRQAKEIYEKGASVDQASLVLDPPLEWFREWVDVARRAVLADPASYPLSVDVETPDKAGGKDEGEISQEDQSYQILRVNLSCHPDEGITVPFVGPYLDELKRLLAPPAVLWLWNKSYDIPRLCAAGTVDELSVDRRAIDLMWLWHILQSDLPQGLGFVAPFYSRLGPWKHLADADPARYGAADGLQTHRCGFGIVGDLVRTGQYARAIRHVHALHALVLKPAQEVGVKIDRERLLIFKADLTQKASDRLDTLQQVYPSDLLPMTPERGLTARPLAEILHVKASAFTRAGKVRKGKPIPELKQDLYKKSIVVERLVLREVLVCKTCGEKEVSRKHRCKEVYTKKDGTQGWRTADHPSEISLEICSVARWFWQEPFNPDSWVQVLAYIKAKKHTPGRAKKTHKESTDRETLERLERTGDPFYRALLDYRAIAKVKGTYVDGTERLLDPTDRVHPEPTFKPSMGRLSYIHPNITNVVADKDGKESLAAGFRNCIVAEVGCRLLECDFSAIEAKHTGWLSRDSVYIRLAGLGVHAALASYILKRPYDPKWSDQDLGAYFKEIKKAEVLIYDRAKHFIHAKNYGLTTYGMVLQFPQIFPTLKVAQEYEAIFYQMAPKVPSWHHQTQQRAAKQHYLGGPGDHPYDYKHWFWSVYTYKKLTQGQYWSLVQRWKKAGKAIDDLPVTMINGQPFKIGLGEDGKRALAFYPQSIAAGNLKEVLLRLFDPDSPSYIGDAYYGKTPLRAPIHDSLLLEVPDRQWDRVFEAVCREMLRPIKEQPLPEDWGLGPYLQIGVAAKVGHSWGETEDLHVPGLTDLGVSTDDLWIAEDEDAEDLFGLRRILRAA
jgi:uracil-DNA glycosylase family 4